MLGDPSWRTLAREERDRVQPAIFPHRNPERVRFIEVSRPENERWLGLSLADLVAEVGGHPSDVLADWVLDNDLAPGVVSVGTANFDSADVGLTMRHPAVFLSGSDDELNYGSDLFTADLPGGGRRLSRPPGDIASPSLGTSSRRSAAN